MPKNRIKILIVDPDARQSTHMQKALESANFHVRLVPEPQKAVKLINAESIDIVISEINLHSDINGFDLMQRVREFSPDTRIVIVTSQAGIETCKQAMRQGAADYFAKPVEPDEILTAIREIVGTEPDVQSLPKEAKPQLDTPGGFLYEGLPGSSPLMKQVFRIAAKVAPTNISVLIQGESGTGKELLARAIHLNSRRADGEFRPINCAGLSETLLESELFGHVRGAFTGAAADRKGLFEIADQGTLFLDEIGDMPLTMQAKLLRVLEDGVIVPVGSNKPVKVDVRVISATNSDLAKMVSEKKMRQDLFFRIKGVSVTIPALRNRRQDIPELIYAFLEQMCREIGRDMLNVSEKAMNILINYNWPGNIRQLRNAVRTMAVMCDGDMIDISDIPPDIHTVLGLPNPSSPAGLAGRPLNEIEKQAIAGTLALVENNREKAANLLGIGERTLYRKIKEYDL
ncbi:Transcriptional regulatory protein ZraR [Limihaloglobus sulfuriphilus]|uniref:Transcriptional regulatory protein ZraR n=1 Tax=Limihaloglobus sulfuriphilus TaxID=1851148 RepID=A0A1Q2MIT0_9BACT|nr:sigma-54 dependent transcriptional regulator [Limihaloglobus sulfuriphilus]AQQ72574.1 Transcriptional regulatory protein ZraR [Limihaloglobus sulfuriphilus]